MKLSILTKTGVLSLLIASGSALGLLAPATVSADTLQCFGEETGSANIVINNNVATATFTIRQACGPQQVSLVSYKSPSPGGQPLNQQTVFQSTTQTLNPGTYSLAVQVPDCYFQVDLVRGGVIWQLSDQHTYHGENRFVTSKNGTGPACTTTTTTPPVTPPASPPAVQSSTTTKSLPNTGAGNVALIGLGSSLIAGLLHANRRRIFGR